MISRLRASGLIRPRVGPQLGPAAVSVVVVSALALSALALTAPALAAQTQPEKREQRQEERQEWLRKADAAADRLEAVIKRADKQGETLEQQVAKAQAASKGLPDGAQVAQAAPSATSPAKPPEARPDRAAPPGAQCRGRLVVEGEGVETAVPDVLRVTFGADARADNPAKALSDAGERTQKLLDAVLAAGVAREDVATTQVSLNPVYDHADRAEGPKIVGWQAGSSLMVSLRDVTKFGSLATAATDAGATRISGVSFEVSDAEARLEKARQAAVKAALARADLLAGAAGRRVGAILELSETGAWRPSPSPVFARAEMAAAKDMPIAEGSQELRASVSATVELCE